MLELTPKSANANQMNMNYLLKKREIFFVLIDKIS